MTETLFANACVVLSDEVISGQVLVRDGHIAAIDTGRGVPAGALDCDGDLLIPGLVELHTDNLERHLEPRPKVGWPHRPAILAHDGELAACGITTVFDALRVGTAVGHTETMDDYARNLADEIIGLRREGALRISHLIHLRAEICSETMAQELSRFGAGDGIGILSLMDHTPGQRQFRDLDQLRVYLCGKRGLSEDSFLAHVAERQALGDRVRAEHEAAAIAAARSFGAVLASHDDTTAEQVADSAGHGVRLAEFPTTAEAAAACAAAGIAVMMGAPNLIRGKSHSGNVAASDLAEAGMLDIVSSDYVPAGLLTAGLLLGDLWQDVARGIATVTAAPAAATGLTDRGRIAPGLRADLVRLRRIEGAVCVRGTWVAGERVA